MTGIKGKSGVYNRTEEMKKKLSISQIGHHFRGKLRIGILHPFFGKHHTPESNLKNRNSHLGKKLPEEQKIKISNSCKGEKHWNWKGGRKKYTVDWTETLRRGIRERDFYTCQICGELQGDKSHDVHHIDYDKNNCNPNNLITLCHSCHTKTNQKREYWKNYLVALVLK